MRFSNTAEQNGFGPALAMKQDDVRPGTIEIVKCKGLFRHWDGRRPFSTEVFPTLAGGPGPDGRIRDGDFVILVKFGYTSFWLVSGEYVLIYLRHHLYQLQLLI